MTEQNEPQTIEQRVEECERGLAQAIHYIRAMPEAIGHQLREVHDNITEKAQRAAHDAAEEDAARRTSEDARRMATAAIQQKQHAQMLAAGTALNVLTEDALKRSGRTLVEDKDWQQKTAVLAWDIADAFLVERERRLWQPCSGSPDRR